MVAKTLRGWGKRIGRTLAVLSALCLACASSAADVQPHQVSQLRVLRIVVDPWPPFGGRDLPEKGISLDVISAVLTRAGYTVETQIVPWGRALDGVKNGTYDGIGNIFRRPALERQLAFSDPFFETEVRFVQKRGGSAQYTTLESLRPFSIAVGEGYLYEPAFDTDDSLRKTTVTNVIDGVRMVAAGRIDLTLDSVDVLNHIIHRQDPSLEAQVEILPQSLTVQQIHFAVGRDLPGHAQMIADFNRVLALMRAEGTLDALLAKHRTD